MGSESLADIETNYGLLDDLLSLLRAQEKRALALLHSAEPLDVSNEDSELLERWRFASEYEVIDYYRAARDHLECWGILGLFLSVEAVFREDLDARWSGVRTQPQQLATALAALPQPTDQSSGPTMRRILAVWAQHIDVPSQEIERLHVTREFRNWLAHGARGQFEYSWPTAALVMADALRLRELVRCADK